MLLLWLGMALPPFALWDRTSFNICRMNQFMSTTHKKAGQVKPCPATGIQLMLRRFLASVIPAVVVRR
jgi:hypothetical protein